MGCSLGNLETDTVVSVARCCNSLELSGSASFNKASFSRHLNTFPLENGTYVAFFRQVFLTTLDLLDAALVSIGGCKEARHNHVVAALEPTVATLLKKQGDGQARLRDGAMNGLVAVAQCRTAGPTFVRCVHSFR